MQTVVLLVRCADGSVVEMPVSVDHIITVGRTMGTDGYAVLTTGMRYHVTNARDVMDVLMGDMEASS